MKIWFPTIRASSGSDVYTERLAAGLRRKGVDARITWFPSYYEFLPELMRSHKIPEDIDVIHANSWNAYVFIGLGIPVVTTVHHLVSDPEYKPYRSAFQAAYHNINVYLREKRAIAKCDSVVSVSEYTGSIVKKIFGQDSMVIPNWVDYENFHPLESTSGNVKFTLLIVGNQGVRKGSDLLPALSEILGTDYEIRVTGGLRSKNKDIRSNGNIARLGRLDEADLIQEYRNADAVVSLSRYEGFGYSALEAMAFRKPFVGFDTSGLAEVVTNGETGFLVPLNDLRLIKERLDMLRRDPALRNSMGTAGLLRAKLVFSEPASIQKYIQIYQSIVNK